MIGPIFCDMDGVLADFSSGAARLMGLNAVVSTHYKWVDDVNENYGPGTWEAIVSQGAYFWDNLEPYEWAKKLWASLVTISEGNTYILSDPGSNGLVAHSGPAKHRWCNRHLGIKEDRIILTSGKEAVARPGAILIDDKESNIEKWEKAGGYGILFPQHWNDNFCKVVLDPIEFVENEIDKL